MKQQKMCGVDGCTRQADYEVILYDMYLNSVLDVEQLETVSTVFYERDYTCPFLCWQHMAENEEQATGVREPRGDMQYPYSNRHGAQGFTIYKPLDKERG
jgi:hypothetical protein